MREILFRGVSERTGSWVEGYFIKADDGLMIHTGGTIEPIAVDSLGEYIGIKDSLGKRIFEGDIVRVPKGTKSDYRNIEGLVVFRDGGFTLDGPHISLNDRGIEVVGNLYDERKQGRC